MRQNRNLLISIGKVRDSEIRPGSVCAVVRTMGSTIVRKTAHYDD